MQGWRWTGGEGVASAPPILAKKQTNLFLQRPWIIVTCTPKFSDLPPALRVALDEKWNDLAVSLKIFFIFHFMASINIQKVQSQSLLYSVVEDKHKGGKPSKQFECRRGANKLHQPASYPRPNSDAWKKRGTHFSCCSVVNIFSYFLFCDIVADTQCCVISWGTAKILHIVTYIMFLVFIHPIFKACITIS